ncbi:hypothetical protein GJAV_G00065750 [Gymnothorax javanicus]|nr:hypothetical protein GJAV_G00065750 [Gymnothorax javanicus]
MKCCGCLFQGNRQNVSDVEDHGREEQATLFPEVHSGQEQNKIVHSLLLERLDDLVDSDLERFHFYLRHEPPQGYHFIPRRFLDGFNRTRTLDEMLKRYGREGAVEVMLDILGKMDKTEEAKTLQTDCSLYRVALGPRQASQLPVTIAPAIRTREKTQVDIEDIETPLTPVVNISGLSTVSQPELKPAVSEHEAALSTAQQKLKAKLRNRFQHIFEGVAKQGRSALLIKVYTEVFITEGDFGQVNTEHEVWNIESVSKRTLDEEVPIECNKIFQPLTSQDNGVKRSVLTKGIAGIGKTVSVQKFILDWVEGRANRDIDFIFPLPFRELNLMKDRKLSLLGLIQHYHPEMELCTTVDLNTKRVLFIFDGLDECRLPLKFHSNETWYKETQELPLDVLLTNLIQGNLLPSCLLWITSRPAAASQIPPECIHRVTEVRGFNDSQKDEYFRRRFDDQSLADRIITHIKSSRSLHIMCHIPVFCWISATVLGDF